MKNNPYTYHYYIPDPDYKEEWKKYIHNRFSIFENHPEEEYDINTTPKDTDIPDKYRKKFMFNRDKYSPLLPTPRFFPTITGFPNVHIELMRPYAKRGFFSGEKYYDYVYALPSCELRRIVNYPLYKMGGPQISIVGNFGTGKSNLLNLLCALYLAKSNVRNFMFNDRRFEARNLAGHGFLNKTTGEFQPFQIDFWIPKGYEFMKGNPLWGHRNNVNKFEYTNINEILDSMQPYRLTVIYDDCFTEEGKLRLWIDFMQSIAESTSPTKHYMFYHHELSSLIPEVPTKNIYALTREAANTALSLRKDRIGMITTFHMPSEVFYRISQKFGFVCFKKPVNHKSMSNAELDAKGFGVKKVNISSGGYWMQHTIGMFPELSDEYRLVPQRTKWTYPNLQPIDDTAQTFISEYLHDPINIEIMRLRAKGLSYSQVADRVEIGKSAVYERARKLNII